MTLGSQVGVIENGRLAQFGTPRQVYEDPVERLCRRAAGQPADQSRAALRRSPRLAMPAARDDGRRAHRARPDHQGQRPPRLRPRHLGRASRRPGPSARQTRRARLRHPCRSRFRPRTGRRRGDRARRSAVLRRRGREGADMTPALLHRLILAVADDGDRPCGRTHRTRSGDRRRRPRHQHEARLRGRAGRRRSDRRRSRCRTRSRRSARSS